jgi:hypothetical protein
LLARTEIEPTLIDQVVFGQVLPRSLMQIFFATTALKKDTAPARPARAPRPPQSQAPPSLKTPPRLRKSA